MERYLGLDVHAASSTLAVISESGKRLQAHVLETNGRVSIEVVRLIPGRKHRFSRSAPVVRHRWRQAEARAPARALSREIGTVQSRLAFA